MLAPTSQMRAARELEPPSLDEGFVDVERVEFTRARHSGTREGVFVAASAVRESGWSAAGDAPHLVFDWPPGGVWMRSQRRSSVSLRASPAQSRRPCALIRADRRRAGAGRRCPD